MKETLGMRLKALRKEKGLSQVELARLIGVGKSIVSLYEKDVSEPTSSKIIAICKCFDVTSDYLLGLKEFSD